MVGRLKRIGSKWRIAGYGREVGDRVTSIYSVAVQAIAQGLAGAVSTMPPFEDKPDADILIIAGKMT